MFLSHFVFPQEWHFLLSSFHFSLTHDTNHSPRSWSNNDWFDDKCLASFKRCLSKDIIGKSRPIIAQTLQAPKLHIENIKRDGEILIRQTPKFVIFHQRLFISSLSVCPGEQNREYAKLHAATELASLEATAQQGVSVAGVAEQTENFSILCRLHPHRERHKKI